MKECMVGLCKYVKNDFCKTLPDEWSNLEFVKGQFFYIASLDCHNPEKKTEGIWQYLS